MQQNKLSNIIAGDRALSFCEATAQCVLYLGGYR